MCEWFRPDDELDRHAVCLWRTSRLDHAAGSHRPPSGVVPSPIRLANRIGGLALRADIASSPLRRDRAIARTRVRPGSLPSLPILSADAPPGPSHQGVASPDQPEVRQVRQSGMTNAGVKRPSSQPRLDLRLSKSGTHPHPHDRSEQKGESERRRAEGPGQAESMLGRSGRCLPWWSVRHHRTEKDDRKLTATTRP